MKIKTWKLIEDTTTVRSTEMWELLDIANAHYLLNEGTREETISSLLVRVELDVENGHCDGHDTELDTPLGDHTGKRDYFYAEANPAQSQLAFCRQWAEEQISKSRYRIELK